MDDKNYFYTVEVKCNNCGAEPAVEIPKGKSVEAGIEKLPCPNCGCTKLTKKG